MNKILRKTLVTLLATCMLVLTGFTVKMPVKATSGNQTNKVELYQLAPEDQSLMQSYVIKTVGGKLIVIDGGIDGEGLTKTPYLPSALRAIAGVGEGEYFEVEAWFLSHAHGDHYYELAKMLNAYTSSSNYKIKNFYFDFPSVFPASDYSETYLNQLKSGLNNYATVNSISYQGSYYDTVNAKVVNQTAIDNGLTLTIDGVAFEILQTWSSSDANVNDNSMIIKMYVDDQSVLFLSDAHVSAGNRLINAYSSDKLKSDIVQMAHHGQSGVNKDVYDVVDAKVHLWTTPEWLWNSTTHPIGVVRDWVGATKTPNDFNLISGLYANYPANPTSVSDWASCIQGMRILLPYAKLHTEFEMVDGASIKTDANSKGITFTARLTEYDQTVEYGFVIVPKSYIIENGIIGDFVSELTDVYGANGFTKITCQPKQEGMHYVVQGSLTQINYSNIDTEYVGIAYSYKGGQYSYASFDTVHDISASVFGVAQKSANDYYYNANTTLTKNDISVINGFIDMAVNKANGVPENQSSKMAVITHKFDADELLIACGGKKSVALTTSFGSDAIIWKSSDNSVATVKDGVVYLHKFGTAYITAKCANHTAVIVVNPKVAI